MKPLLEKIFPSFARHSDIYSSYDHSRHISDHAHLCHAPFNNMYFNVHGHIAPCWLTLDPSDVYPARSVSDIWFGDRFSQIRKSIEARELNPFCKTCKKNIDSGNYVSVLAKLYDSDYKLAAYPASMEFELSNICNLECVMCKGDLSSSIRQNREKQPALPLPYDHGFVKQLEEFIPHLREAKFLGGEPFLIDIYFEIWDRILKMNPGIKITVTTNGTALNSRIKDLLEVLDFNLIISIDSFFKETYRNIRIKGDYERVMENLDYFLDYAKRKNKFLQVSINPLRKNWHELHEYVSFCNSRNINLWFNTVTYPYSEALWTWDSETLTKIYEFLSAQISTLNLSGHKDVVKNNIRNFKNLVEVQIKNWQMDATRREKERSIATSNDYVRSFWSELEQYIDSDAYLAPYQKASQKALYKKAIDAIQNTKPENYQEIFEYLYKQPMSKALEILGDTSMTEISGLSLR